MFRSIDRGLKVVGPIAAKGRLKRGELRELDEVESVVGDVFSGFNNIHNVLCREDEDGVDAGESEGVAGKPPDAQNG